MASIYTHETLRKMFQSAFQLAEWYSFLQHFFHATELKKTPESIHTPHAEEEGHYIGCIETSDYFRIGLFCYQIRKGSVANRRVGLRNLSGPSSIRNGENLMPPSWCMIVTTTGGYPLSAISKKNPQPPNATPTYSATKTCCTELR